MNIPLPTTPGGYRTIIADPPWAYRQKLGRGKSEGDLTRGGLPYEPMTIEAIQALPVRTIAADDSVCLLWTTTSHLEAAFAVLRSWGFEYKQAGAWGKVGNTGKVQIGIGYWLRPAVEFFLLGIRGNPRSKFTGPHGTSGNGLSNLILAPRQQHSQKPPNLHEIAEAMFEAPRIELFARSRRMGWDAWGNQAPADPIVEEGLSRAW